jgi:hypothetical protein
MLLERETGDCTRMSKSVGNSPATLSRGSSPLVRLVSTENNRDPLLWHLLKDTDAWELHISKKSMRLRNSLHHRRFLRRMVHSQDTKSTALLCTFGENALFESPLSFCCVYATFLLWKNKWPFLSFYPSSRNSLHKQAGKDNQDLATKVEGDIHIQYFFWKVAFK